MIVASTALAGCYNGPGATTTMQAMQPTGNGTQTAVGDMRIENATLITNDAVSSLVTRIYNDGQSPDVMTEVIIGGQQAAVQSTVTQLDPGADISFGFPVGSPDVIVTGPFPVSQYVPVKISFLSAGSVEFTVLAVPPTGIYQGLLG